MNETTSLQDLCRREDPANELYLRYVSMGSHQYEEREKFAFYQGMLFLFTQCKNDTPLYAKLHDILYSYLVEKGDLESSFEKKLRKQLVKSANKKYRHIFAIQANWEAAFYGMVTMYSVIGTFKDDAANDDLIVNLMSSIVKGRTAK